MFRKCDFIGNSSSLREFEASIMTVMDVYSNVCKTLYREAVEGSSGQFGCGHPSPVPNLDRNFLHLSPRDRFPVVQLASSGDFG